jgi:hypothetical protein
MHRKKISPEVALLLYIIAFIIMLAKHIKSLPYADLCKSADFFEFHNFCLGFYSYIFFVLLSYKYNFACLGRGILLIIILFSFGLSIDSIYRFIHSMVHAECRWLFKQLFIDLHMENFLLIMVIEFIIFIILVLILTKKPIINQQNP